MAAQENLPLCATVREDNLQDNFSRHCQEICNEWTFRNNHLSVFHAHTSWNVIIMIETRIPNLCYRSILIYLCYTCRCWYVLHLNIHFISCSLPSILVRTYALSLKCVQTHTWQELKSGKKKVHKFFWTWITSYCYLSTGSVHFHVFAHTFQWTCLLEVGNLMIRYYH